MSSAPAKLVSLGAAVLAVFSVAVARAQNGPAMRFDIATYCCGCTATSPPQNFCDLHFSRLNYGSQSHYFAMGTDNKRSEITAAGNALAVYHNDLNTNYTSKTPAQKAGEVDQYVRSRFITNGPRPDWVLIEASELS